MHIVADKSQHPGHGRSADIHIKEANVHVPRCEAESKLRGNRALPDAALAREDQDLATHACQPRLHVGHCRIRLLSFSGGAQALVGAASASGSLPCGLAAHARAALRGILWVLLQFRLLSCLLLCWRWCYWSRRADFACHLRGRRCPSRTRSVDQSSISFFGGTAQRCHCHSGSTSTCQGSTRKRDCMGAAFRHQAAAGAPGNRVKIALRCA
mmetsp:Transcript_15082/g.33182  ORF Transcript_15082/g.33182 Transcript_15082/m.33182 type:complete len:212 (+) Transcript_15082:698-1333(+)